MGYLSFATLFVREAEAEYGPEASEGSDPSSPASPDVEALDELGHEIAVLSAHIESATQRLLTLIARFDEGRGWEVAGFSSCAEWLALRTGIDRGAARERVRTARALRDLPLTSQALGLGELTFSKVRALTRVAEADTEAELLEMARTSTASELERMVRGWKVGSLKDELERDEWRHRNRCLSVFPDLDGSYVVKGRLTPEVGVLLMRAIEAAGDALYRKESAQECAYHTRGRATETEGQAERRRAKDTEAAAARRRADALALLVERAMTVALGVETTHEAGPTTSGTSAERYQVMVHVDLKTLREPHPLDRTSARQRKRARKTRLDRIVEAAREAGMVPGDGAGPEPQGACGCGARSNGHEAELEQSHIEDTHVGPRDARPSRGPSSESHCESPDQSLGSAATGPFRRDHSHIDDVGVSAETSRRMSCDASMIPVVRSEGAGGRASGAPSLSLGRRTRSISPALRRALEVRDRGCRFPGCGSRFTDAHHIRHWADGGETSLSNCILLCRHHHRLVHEGGWGVTGGPSGRPIFHDRRGGMHFDGRWTAPALSGDPVARLIRENGGPGDGGVGHGPPDAGG